MRWPLPTLWCYNCGPLDERLPAPQLLNTAYARCYRCGGYTDAVRVGETVYGINDLVVALNVYGEVP